MPYKLRGNCVVKADSGETVKCHETRKKALAHLAALEINVMGHEGRRKKKK
jgi:hypothetical protein